jgi:hypothetical protein
MTPHLRIVKGDPTPEELAALTAVLLAARSARAPKRAQLVREWNNPSRLVRPSLPQGRGGWRHSGLPL